MILQVFRRNLFLLNLPNRLIGVWKGLLEGEKVFSPFGVLNFLEQREEFLSKNRFTQTGLTQNPINLLSAMQALVTHLIRATHDRVTLFLSQGKSDFEARNESQCFLAKDLSLVFVQTTVLDRFLRHINDHDLYEGREKLVLNDLAYLYGLSCLQGHLPHLLQFGIFPSPDFVGWINTQVVHTCNKVTF